MLYSSTGESNGGREGPCPPLATWACAQNALKVSIFRLKIEKVSGEGAIGRGQCPLPRPQLVLLCINHNVVSDTLVLSPRAICIHTTASFPTSNGFLRLKRFNQSMEEWTMNCKNSAQNALKVAIFRLKIEKFSGEGAPPPQTSPLGASILAPSALDLGPPFANPGSATGNGQKLRKPAM